MHEKLSSEEDSTSFISDGWAADRRIEDEVIEGAATEESNFIEFLYPIGISSIYEKEVLDSSGCRAADE